MATTESKKKWVPLESNPEVMNTLIYNLGVSKQWAYTDVWTLGPEVHQMIPQPVIAVFLLFPITEKTESHRREQEALLISANAGQVASSDIRFYKQTIPNACGTIGLLHSLANNLDYVEIADGPLKRLIEKTNSLTPDERAEVLEADDELAEAHQRSATSGQSRVPGEDEEVNLHFTCFIQKGGNLYELDGRRSFPINHGPSTDLLPDSIKIIKQFMERDPNETQFTVIALAPNAS